MTTARRAWFFPSCFVACLLVLVTISRSPANVFRTGRADEAAATGIVFRIFVQGLGPQPPCRLESGGTLLEFDSNHDGFLTAAESDHARAALHRQAQGIDRLRTLFELILSLPNMISG